MIKLGLILAGGKGTRLHPITEIINKHLLPIYNKPMIYYPLTTLLMLGCNKIIILTNSEDKFTMNKICEKLQFLNVKCSLKFQGANSGIPSAILDGIKDESFTELYTILGDNIFFGNNFIKDVLSVNEKNLILTKEVRNPSHFGILNSSKEKIEIIEKPKTFIGNEAVTGFYKFDNNINKYLERAVPSKRGETEIADVLNAITIENENFLKQIKLNRATLWLDAGTFENLNNSCALVSQIIQRQGQDFGCIEEAALEKNYINKKNLKKLIQNYPNNDYKNYIEHLLDIKNIG